MRKFVALSMVIVMLLALSIPAFAATVPGGDSAPASASTDILYTVAQSYMFTTPVKLDVDGESSMITVTEYNLLPTNKVQVSVSAPTWKLGEASYAINGRTDNGLIAEFTNSSVEFVKATFVADPPYAAGTYSEVVTFTTSIVPR